MSEENLTGNATGKVSSLMPYIICAVATSFYLYEFLIRVLPSVMTSELMTAYGIGTGALGMMAAYFFWGYTPMQLPVGLLYDKYGPRRLLSLAIFVCALATLLFAWTTNFYLAAFSRFLMGVTGAFAFIGPLVTASRWFPPKYFAMYTGLVQFMGCIGSIVGQSPVAALKGSIGWRATIVWIALFGLVFSAMNWLIIRDHPNTPEAAMAAKERSKTSSRFRFAAVLRNPQTWWIGLSGFTCWAPIEMFASLWGISFLCTLYHISTTAASYLNDMVWIGLAIGSPLVGWWSNKVNRRVQPLAICFLIGLIASLIMIYGGPLPLPVMAILLFAFGFSASAQSITFGLVIDNNQQEQIGTAVGFNNMAVIAGAIVFQPLIGYCLQIFDPKTTESAINLTHSLYAFHWALIFIPFCHLLGLIITGVLVRETYCRSVYLENH